MTIVLTEASTTTTGDRCTDDLWLTAEDTLRSTGWTIKPEGLCKAESCVSVPPGRETEFTDDGRINVSAFWRLMGNPVVHSPASDAWFLGEGATGRNDALLSLAAPDFTLPDLDGKLHSLTDFRKMRILLATWASW